MSPKQLSSSSQQPFLSTGSSDLRLGIGQHRWLRLLGLVFLLYLAILPLWWLALGPLTALVTTCADIVYHFFDSSVSIVPDARIARVTLEASDILLSGGQAQESALRMDTITYGMPMLAALIVATRPARVLGKLEALESGLAIMTALTVLAVVAWAKLASLEAYDQMVFATTGSKGHTSAFIYYCFHGYAFSQPVTAVILWMGISMSGVFDGHPMPVPKDQALDPKSPCHCGSGRQYRRCCGKSARLKRA